MRQLQHMNCFADHYQAKNTERLLHMRVVWEGRRQSSQVVLQHGCGALPMFLLWGPEQEHLAELLTAVPHHAIATWAIINSDDCKQWRDDQLADSLRRRGSAAEACQDACGTNLGLTTAALAL
jgi:hypothetical protein